MNSTRNQQIATWKERDVSWSQLSSWIYSKEQWANKYLFDKPEPANPAMIFGNTVGDTLGLPHSMVPKLNPQLVGIKEYKLRVKMGDHYLLGFCDHYCPEQKILNENKTSQKPNRWTTKEVEAHGQLTMYALMLYLQNKTKPEEVKMFLNFIPVTEGQDFQLRVDPENFKTFATSRTLKQCLMFGAEINKTLKEMEAYAQIAPDPVA
jgi:hypothetical protein